MGLGLTTRESYTAHVWEPREPITRTRMNIIEDELARLAGYDQNTVAAISNMMTNIIGYDIDATPSQSLVAIINGLSNKITTDILPRVNGAVEGAAQGALAWGQIDPLTEHHLDQGGNTIFTRTLSQVIEELQRADETQDRDIADIKGWIDTATTSYGKVWKRDSQTNAITKNNDPQALVDRIIDIYLRLEDTNRNVGSIQGILEPGDGRTIAARLTSLDGGPTTTPPSRTLQDIITEVNNAHYSQANHTNGASGQQVDHGTLDERFESDETRLKAAETNISNLDRDKVAFSDIVNNLSSSDTNKPLSALQGKTLKDTIGGAYDTTNTVAAGIITAQTNAQNYADTNKVDKQDIYNDVDYTESGKVLDARVGKTLQDAIDSISDNLDGNGGLVDRIEALESEVDMTSANSRIDVLESDLDAAEDDISGLDTRLDTAEGKISSLESADTGLGGRITTLENTVNHATTGLAATKAIADAAKATADTALQPEDITQLTSDVNTLKGKDTIIVPYDGQNSNYTNNTPNYENPSTDADYLIENDEGSYYYWRYFGAQDGWQLIGGAGSGNSSAMVFNSYVEYITATNTKKDEFTDYYVKDANDYYTHYRFVKTRQNDEDVYVQIEIKQDAPTMSQIYTKSETYNKSEVAEAITEALNNADISSYTFTYGTQDYYGPQGEAGAAEGTVPVMTENVLSLFRLDQGAIDPISVSQAIIAGGGGGSGVSGAPITFNRITETPLVITSSSSAIVSFEYSCVDDNVPIGGYYTWYKGTQELFNGSLVQGTNTFDLTEYCAVGVSQRFKLVITNEQETALPPKFWDIQVVEIGLESNFNDNTVYNSTNQIEFTYVPYGNISKTVHIELDGTALDTVTTSDSGRTNSYRLPLLAHGSHIVKVWLTATIQNNTISTEAIYKHIVCVEAGNNTPIIGCIYEYPYYTDAEHTDDPGYVFITQYNTLSIPYYVYDPVHQFPQISLQENSGSVNQRELSTNQDIWSYKASDYTVDAEEEIDGFNTLTISCGTTSITIRVKVEKLDIGISPITANLAFDFNPSGYSNDDIEHRLWSYTPEGESTPTTSLTVSNNFDWSNGGWKIDEDGNTYFCVKSGNRAYINYELFNRNLNIRTNGQELKCIFKVEQVRNINASFLRCLSSQANDNVGFEMRAHEAYVKTSSASLYLPYSEEDLIEFEYNIFDENNGSYIMGYEDGVGTRPLLYDELATLYQNTPAIIEIGSDDCDIRIYRLKVYTSSLTDEEVLMNFYADAFNSDEMIARYERNQIYDENNKLTPWSVANACPDLKVIMIEAPYFTNNKSDYVKDTKVTCLHKGGDAVLDNWYFENGYHAGQGTTSNEYGAAGRNIDIIFGFDGTHTVVSKIAENDVQGYVSKVTLGVDNEGQGVPLERRQVLTGKDAKVALSRTSVPNDWFNIKVNIASSENANNALLQKRYNDYLPYSSPARKRDSKVKNDMEFFNCVIFLKESGPVENHREFLDTEWHFYGIGNIGDSKKTDNTRVNDPEDMKEFCVEISDNTLPNSAFYTGVYWANAEHTAITYDENIGYEMKYPININKVPTDLQPWVEIGYRKVNNPSASNLSSLYELSNGIYSLTQDSSVDSEKTYYEYFTRTITNDVVNEWSEFDGYVPVTESKQLNKKNLGQFYEYSNGAYTLTNDTSINSSKTYYIRQYKNRRYQSLYIPIQNYDASKDKYSYVSGWDTSFEFRYDMGTKDGESISDAAIKAQQEQSKLKFSEMYEWVISASNEDFVNHFDDWFITDSYLYWYLFTERYTMIDNRAKNTFWHYGKIYITAQEAEELSTDAVNYILDAEKAAINDGYRFELWDYDNDTALGINNSGELTMTYGKEDIDYRTAGDPTSGYVFNAAESVIWRRIRGLMGSQLTTMYNNRPAACWSAASLIKEFDDWQAQFPEELWRLDIERKYLRPYLIGSYNSSQQLVTTNRFLKEMMNGRKKYQRRQFERDQEVYIGTKYISNSIRDDQIMFRCNKPAQYAVKPDFTLEIVPYSDMYLTVMFGNTTPVQVRAKAGIAYQIESTLTEMDDTAVLVYAASHIQALNDLSACYIHDNDFSKAIKLSTLIIGNNTPGYTNTFLTSLHLGDNGLLTTLDIRNCPNLNEPLNLSKCHNLTTLNASNTSLTTVSFPVGGKLTTAILPNTLTNLTVNSLKNLTNLNIAGYDNLTIFYCKDTNNINPLAIVQETIDTLNEVTVLGLDWTLNDNDFSLLETIMSKSVSMLSGTIHTNQQIRQHILNEVNSQYKGQLTIDHAGIITEYTILYKNYNGDLLYTDYRTSSERYRDPASLYVDDIDPITNTSRIAWNRLVKPADAALVYKFGRYNSEAVQDQSTYVRFSGWVKDGTTTNPLPNELVNGPMTLFAYYPTTEDRQYTVRWFEEEGGSAKSIVTRQYGSDMSTVSPAPETTIVRAKRVGNVVKVFKGWNRPVGHLTEDIDVYAQWETSTIDNSITSAELNMSNLNAADIYALSLLDNSVKSSILEDQLVQNPIFVQMGHEFDYTEGTTMTDLLHGASKFTFSGLGEADVKIYDGAHGVGEIRPLSVNQDWTIALDYKFLLDNTVFNQAKEFVLASCYKNADSSIDGFKLSLVTNNTGTNYKNHSIVVTWGTQSVTIDYLATAVDTTVNAKQYMRGYRNMVVLRHNTTEPNSLYVYYTLPATDAPYGIPEYGYGSEYGTTINTTQLTWDANRNIDIPLILGGNFVGNSTTNIEQDQNNRGPAKAIIYWAKYWDADLGNKYCRTLAAWPHEKIPFYLSGYSGNNQVNRQIIDNTKFTFVAAQGVGDRYLFANRKLQQTVDLQTSDSPDSVWSYTRARSLCNNRVYNGFSIPYQSIIAQTALTSYGRNLNTNTITSYNTSDYVFLTAEAELTTNLSYGDKDGEIIRGAGPWPWLKASNIKNLYRINDDGNLTRQSASSINPFLFRFSNGYTRTDSIIFNTGAVDPDKNRGWQIEGSSGVIYPKSGDIWIRDTYNGTSNVAFIYFTNAEINEGIYVDVPTDRGGWKKADLWQLRSLNLTLNTNQENLFERIEDNGQLLAMTTAQGRRSEPRLLCPEFAV